MRKDEQTFGTQIQRWLKYNKKLFSRSFKIEYKVVRLGEKRFPFRELSEKEERLLLKAKHDSVIQTNSDFGRLGTYCDADIVGGGGYIFIKWIRRGNKEFYAIDIDHFIIHRNKSKRKSLTETEAKQISYLTGYLA